MRRIEQPGPAVAERIQCVEARGRAFSFTMGNGGAVVGVFRFAAGRRQATWEKAASTRATPSRGYEAGGVGSVPVAAGERGARRRFVEK